MKTYDVVIVGGGPAGSSCAWRLKQHGLRTAVMDLHAFPRVKPCAGWVTPQVIAALDIDLEDYRREHTLQPITGFVCGMIDGQKTVDIGYDHEISFGIRRVEFDNYLLRRSGAELHLNEAATTVERQGASWVINNRFSAPMIVGAGGHRCPIARQLGARLKPASVVVAKEVEFTVDDADCAGVDPLRPQLFFCTDLLGYGWCFRKGQHLNIGLGRTDHAALPQHVAAFTEFIWRHNQLRCDVPDHWLGHAYQLYERVKPTLMDDGVLLVGDAAGLASAVSGEGIRPAVESGILAADVIQLAEGHYTIDRLDPYRERLLERFGPPRPSGLLDRMPVGLLNYVGAHLLTTHWFCRRFLLDKWFLHRQQPALN